MKRETIGLIVIAILTALLIYFYYKSEKHKEEVKSRDSVISEKNDVIKYHVNNEGRILGEKKAAEIHAKELEQMYPHVYAELKKEFDIQQKNLKAYIKNEFSAIGTGTGSVVNNHYYDSTTRRNVRFRNFNMDDGYLKFNTTLYDSLFNAPYSYSYSDTASTVIHKKRKWLLGKEELYSTTKFSNPNAKITGTTNILVKDYRDKRWSVMIGAGYDPFYNKPTAMIGLGYSIFKF